MHSRAGFALDVAKRDLDANVEESLASYDAGTSVLKENDCNVQYDRFLDGSICGRLVSQHHRSLAYSSKGFASA